MERIKLLHVVPSLSHGGTEQLLYDILSRLDSARFDISICCTHENGDLWQHKRFHSHGIQTAALLQTSNRFQRMYKLLSYLRKNRFDIVHIHNYEDNLIYARVSAILAGVPIIMTYDHNIHNIWYSRKQQWIWSILNCFTYRNVTISETVREQRLKCCGGYYEKVMVVMNGVDTERFTPHLRKDSARAKRALGIKSTKKVVGGIGRLIDWKRFNLLVEAASIIDKRYEVEFLIIGDGPLLSQLIRQAKELKVDDRVKFLGWQSNIHDIYCALDFLVVTADWPEGFGLVVAEAMASGIPIVAVDNPTHREVISNCGILVAPEPEEIGKSVACLLDDAHLAATLAERGRKRTEEYFDINRTARELEALYLEAMQDRGKLSSRPVVAEVR